MPADRTTHSFTAAAVLNLPLSSHGPNHAPSLERGKACLVCRSRKIKCDGAKPVCSACARSASAHGEDPANIVCNYDEGPGKGDKKPRANGAGKVAALQQKIAELEKIISDAQEKKRAEPSTSAAGPSTFPSQAPSYFNTTLPVIGNSFESNLFNPISSVEALLNASNGHFSSIGIGQEYSTANFFDNQSPAIPTLIPPISIPPDDLLAIFYPGWSSELPSPAFVGRLVETYFSRSHIATGMLNQSKFMAALTLPPTHAGFPSLALLHSVLATAALMVSPAFFSPEDPYWLREDLADSPADYHGKRAKAAIEESITTGKKLLQTMQAAVLMTFHYHTRARFVDLWLLCGMSTRLATPLGLNHIRRASADGTSRERLPSVKASLLPPTDDPDEIYERATTFWLAVACDRFASASTGWAMSLDDSDITSLLPSPTHSYPTDDMTTSPLSPQNPSLFLTHPPQIVQTLQLFFKSVILLGRVVAWNQRWPSVMASGKAARPTEESSEPVDLRNTPSFKRLDADALTFRLSIPREYQLQYQAGPQDSRIWLIFAIPHAATILLHEWFCTTQEGDVSLARCLLSARTILNAIFGLLSSSFEPGHVAPCLLFCWTVAGRTLVRDVALKLQRGQLAEAEAIKVDVMSIISAMKAVKSPVGDMMAGTLQVLLDDPDQCLPHTSLTHEGLVFGPNTATPYCGPSDAYPEVISQTNPKKKTGLYNMPIFGTANSSSPGSSASPGGTFSSTSAPSPVDYTSLFAQTANIPENTMNYADSERFKEMILEMPDASFGWTM